MYSKNNNARILFRADGNNEIGLGHVYRCLAIAERLSGNFDCYFAIRNPSDELKKTISKSSTLIELKEYKNYKIEADDLSLNIISLYHIDIITLDGYLFNTEYQKTIKEKCNAVLVSIDDDHPFHYVSDIVINHAGGIDADKISKESYTKLLLGYDYLLLRKEFISLQKKEKYISGVHSVLICFGGSDPNDLTGTVLNCLKHESNIHKIIIVVGASYLQTEKLKHSISSHSHIEIKNNLDAEALAEIMSNTDLAIVPSSTIALEAFASKMILITGVTADNQQNIYKGLMKEDTVIGIGDFSLLTCEELLKYIDNATLKFYDYTVHTKFNVNDAILDAFKSIVL